VLEQAGGVGGKLGWFSRDGHSFDTGPSLMTMPQVYRDLFTATGGPSRTPSTWSGWTPLSTTGSPTGPA
jgi:phytoene dehydrogenase-like protein